MRAIENVMAGAARPKPSETAHSQTIATFFAQPKIAWKMKLFEFESPGDAIGARKASKRPRSGCESQTAPCPMRCWPAGRKMSENGCTRPIGVSFRGNRSTSIKLSTAELRGN